jgi:hypothetical protein
MSGTIWNKHNLKRAGVKKSVRPCLCLCIDSIFTWIVTRPCAWRESVLLKYPFLIWQRTSFHFYADFYFSSITNKTITRFDRVTQQVFYKKKKLFTIASVFLIFLVLCGFLFVFVPGSQCCLCIWIPGGKIKICVKMKRCSLPYEKWIFHNDQPVWDDNI